MRVQPRIEVLDPAAERLEPPFLPAVALREPIGTAVLALIGAAVLTLGLGALSAANFVIDQYGRSATLGWITLAVAVAGFGLIGIAMAREWRSLLRLHQVDRLRALLADPATARAAALAWLGSLPTPDPVLPAVREANDPDAILALLRAGPVASLRAQAEALGRAAAVQVFAATAAVPSPALDGLIVGWRGTLLVRKVAALHGLRPGLLGTVALLKRTLFSAAAVAATEMAGDAAARAILSNPLLAHIAGDVAGAGVAARRMIVLSRATANACNPIE